MNFLICSQYWLLGAKPNDHTTQQHTQTADVKGVLVKTNLCAGLSSA